MPRRRATGGDLWDRSPETDRAWADVCAKIRTIYPQVKAAGFRGVVYDTESYYSYQGDEAGLQKPWVWGGHASQYGPQGMYYRRGQQMGAAMKTAWPGIRVIMVYAFGYPGERWWYEGVRDAGVTLLLGPEHTYGAGPPGDLGAAWYQSWWQGRQQRHTGVAHALVPPSLAGVAERVDHDDADTGPRGLHGRAHLLAAPVVHPLRAVLARMPAPHPRLLQARFVALVAVVQLGVIYYPAEAGGLDLRVDGADVGAHPRPRRGRSRGYGPTGRARRG